MGSVKSVAGFQVFVACIHYILGTVSYRPNRSPESRCYIHNHHDHCFCCWCSTSSSSSSSYALANNGPQYCSFFGVLRIPTTKRRDWVQSSPRRFFDMNWAGKTPSPDSEEEQGQGHDTNKTRRENCWFARCTAENEVISFRFFGFFGTRTRVLFSAAARIRKESNPGEWEKERVVFQSSSYLNSW